MGDGSDIDATKDQWLSRKTGWKVDDSHLYMGRHELVSSLFYPGTKVWDVGRVQELFIIDAMAILATRVPQHEVRDRIAWFSSSNGIYNVKDGYRYWHDQNVRNTVVTQSNGWNRIWSLPLPHN